MNAIARFYQRGKNGIHALQALVIFIGAVVTIAIFTKSGKSDGRIRYYFALCWLCIPALVYQTAFPIFERTKRFANPYAHAVIDIVYMILWFAAFIGVEVWVRQGSQSAKDWDGKKDKLCDKFAYGPTSKCKLGQATGIIGVIIWLLFILTTALSIYGSLPTSSPKAAEAIPASDASDDYNFSSNPHSKLSSPQHSETQPMHHTDDGVSSLHNPSEADYHTSQHGHRSPSPISTIHTTQQRYSYDRAPSPELPMSRPPQQLHQSPTSDQADWAHRLPRLPTPELPMGEGFYPVDTSYHSTTSPPQPSIYKPYEPKPYPSKPYASKPYDPPPSVPPSESRYSPPLSAAGGRRTPSPLYEHSNESNFLGQSGTIRHMRENGNPFADELGRTGGYGAGGGGYGDGGMVIGNGNGSGRIEEDGARIGFPEGNYRGL